MQKAIEHGLPSHSPKANQSLDTPESTNELLEPYSSNGSEAHRDGPVLRRFDNPVVS